jgi:hypothetical protein
VSDTPSVCPFCGSYVALLDCGQPCGDSEGNWTAFRCLTSWHRGYHDPRKLQSKTCETVERHKLYDRIKRLEEALEGTVKWIVHLADSGDAGFWDVEKQSEIIAARAALKKESKP